MCALALDKTGYRFRQATEGMFVWWWSVHFKESALWARRGSSTDAELPSGQFHAADEPASQNTSPSARHGLATEQNKHGFLPETKRRRRLRPSNYTSARRFHHRLC
jgi:hypothetical protein